MVDNINPIPQSNPAEPLVSDVAASAPVQPAPATPATNPFYSGFDRPADVHVNLADSTPAPNPVSSVSEPQVSQEPVTAKVSDFRPAEPAVNHEAYVGHQSEPVNWWAVAFISGIGILAVILFGTISYFSAGFIYGKQLTDAKTELSAGTSRLNKEKQAPQALELPVQQTPPATSTPTPQTPVEEAPIQTPATAPATPTENGGMAANG